MCKTLTLLLLGALLAIFAFGCSSDDDKTPTGSDDPVIINPTSIEELNNAPVTALMGSGNEYAASAAGYISMAEGYSGWFTPPSSSIREEAMPRYAAGDSTTYTWTMEDFTVTMSWVERATVYYWVVIIDGTDGEVVFDNFKMLEAEALKDGSSGWMKLFLDPDAPQQVFMSWTWTSITDGDFTMNLTVYNDDGSVIIEAIIVIHNDGSGYVEFRNEGVLFWRVTWVADGMSGTWEYYGDPPTSGTWSYTE